MQTKNISVIIPSYLEEENLRVIIPRLQTTLSELHCTYEILIVDTMKPMDNTKKVCDMYGGTYLPRSGGNNYGDAIRTGIRAAQGTYTIFMDADGSHAPEFIKNMYEHRTGNDVVIASRYVDGGETDNGKVLIFMSWVVNAVYSLVLQLNCKDVSNSFKLYKTDELKKLTLKCDNFDIVEEILFKLQRNKKRLIIKELPYSFKKRMFGNTKRNLVVFMLTYVVTLIRLRLSK